MAGPDSVSEAAKCVLACRRSAWLIAEAYTSTSRSVGPTVGSGTSASV